MWFKSNKHFHLLLTGGLTNSGYSAYLRVVQEVIEYNSLPNGHTGKCKRRYGGIYAYFRYLKDRKW